MAAPSRLVVLLEGRVIGWLDRLEHGRLRLTYADDHRDDPDETPLSLSMPKATRTHHDAAITPWLWGLLPDNDRVLARWGRAFGVSTSSPFSLLATQVGHDCAGAVQLVEADHLETLQARGGSVDWLDEGQVAARLRELKEDDTAWLGPGFTGQFSLGGAQAKTALLLDDDRGWGLPTGAVPTTHILKPAMAGLEAQDLNEHLCSAAARSLGLLAAHTEVLRIEDVTAIVVRRFDRRMTSDGVVRVHQEDVAQALGRHPGEKYQAEGGPSPGQIADLFRTGMSGPDAEAAVVRFADALVFNWLIAGTDAHSKNYSIQLDGPHARLAPLYDLASYLPYDDSEGHKVKLAMKIGGEYRLLQTDSRRAWELTARELKVDADALILRALTMSREVADAFAAAASDDRVADLGSRLPLRLVDLVAQRARSCERALGGGSVARTSRA